MLVDGNGMGRFSSICFGLQGLKDMQTSTADWASPKESLTSFFNFYAVETTKEERWKPV